MMSMVEEGTGEDLSRRSTARPLGGEGTNEAAMRSLLGKCDDLASRAMLRMTTFETRLSDMEQNMEDVHAQTQSMSMRRANISKVLQELENTRKQIRIVEAEEDTLTVGMRSVTLDRYFVAVQRVCEAQDFFRAKNRAMPQFEKVVEQLLQRAKTEMQEEFVRLAGAAGGTGHVDIEEVLADKKKVRATQSPKVVEVIPEATVGLLHDICKHIFMIRGQYSFPSDYAEVRRALLKESLQSIEPSGLLASPRDFDRDDVALTITKDPAMQRYVRGTEALLRVCEAERAASLAIFGHSIHALMVVLEVAQSTIEKCYEISRQVLRNCFGSERVLAAMDLLESSWCSGRVNALFDIFVTAGKQGQVLQNNIESTHSGPTLASSAMDHLHSSTMGVASMTNLSTGGSSTDAASSRKTNGVGSDDSGAGAGGRPTLAHARGMAVARRCQKQLNETAYNFQKHMWEVLLEGFREAEQYVSGHNPRHVPPRATVHQITSNVLHYIKYIVSHRSTVAECMRNVKDAAPNEFVHNGFKASLGDRYPERGVCLGALFSLADNLQIKSDNIKDASERCLFQLNNLHHVVSYLQRTTLRGDLKGANHFLEQIKGVPLVSVIGSEAMAELQNRFEGLTEMYLHNTFSKCLDHLLDKNSYLDDISALEADAPTTMPKATRNMIKGRFEGFNSAFEATVAQQRDLVVPDDKLRADLRQRAYKFIFPIFQDFLKRYADLPFTSRHGKYLIYDAKRIRADIDSFFASTA